MDRAASISEIAKGRSDYAQQIETLVALLRCFVLRPGNNAIDGGASGGGHSRGMSLSVGPTGHVYSIEAVPGGADWLKSVYKERGMHNIDVYGFALGKENKIVEFIINPENSGLNHVRFPGETVDAKLKTVTVEMKTIDSIVDPSKNISFMKLDVEGLELDVMKGGREMIDRDRPIIVFENARANDKEEYCSFFDEIGYEVYDFFSSKITRENYHSHLLSHEAVCGPADSPLLAQARWIVGNFWQNLQHIPPLTSWSSAHWEDPLAYLR